MIQHTPSVILLEILQLTIALKLVFMFLATRKSPGYLPKNTEDEENKGLIPEERPKQTAGVICKECSSRRPLRTFHCSMCYRCVFRYDHHSLLLNTCIGYSNQIFYGVFLFCSLAMDYLCCYILVRYLNSDILHSVWSLFCLSCIVVV